MSEGLTIRSSDGLAIEGALDRAESAVATLVVCHPHPQMGGTMNAPLLLALRDHMIPAQWNVLRFNYRGIGGSEGQSSTGTDELQDAAGALDVAESLGVPIALCGWSFGAAVAIRTAATREGLVGCVGIAPAIDPKPGITEGVSDAVPKCPALVIVGSNDDLVSPSRARTWADDVGADAVIMEGANHFFWGKYEGLSQAVSSWLADRL